MMVVDHLDQLRELSGNPDFNVHCYSYAPVASVSQDLSEKYKDHIDSFVCHDDLVGRLSYGTASCAKELIMDSLIAVDGFGGSTKVLSNPSIRKECFDIIQTRRKEIYHGKEPRYPLLYVPGTVYQFRRGGARDATKLAQDIKLPGTTNEPTLKRRASTTSSSSFAQQQPAEPNKEDVTFTLHKSSCMLSEEAYISKTCLEDHMVVTYLTAFQTARQDCMRQASYRRAKLQQGQSVTSFSSSSSTLKTSPVSTVKSNTALHTSSSLKTSSATTASNIKLDNTTNTTAFTRIDQEAA